jgi:hypothetical protein
MAPGLRLASSVQPGRSESAPSVKSIEVFIQSRLNSQDMFLLAHSVRQHRDRPKNLGYSSNVIGLA